jgi:hypothetical protein
MERGEGSLIARDEPEGICLTITKVINKGVDELLSMISGCINNASQTGHVRTTILGIPSPPQFDTGSIRINSMKASYSARFLITPFYDSSI